VFGHDLLDHARAAEGLDSCAHPHLDAVVGVQRPVGRGDLRTQHRLQRRGIRVHHGDLTTELSGRGCDFGADPAAADDDNLGRSREPRSEAVGVVEIPEVEDAVQPGAGPIEAPRFRASGQEQPLVADAVAVFEHRLAAVTIDAVHRRARMQLNAVFLVEAVRVNDDLVEAGLPSQIAL
jgi:hypothetical protein